jgi:hypothetical protein
MNKRNITKIVVLATVCLVVFFGVNAGKSSKETIECTESMEECCKKDKEVQGEKMIWESLPQQFFSSI